MWMRLVRFLWAMIPDTQEGSAGGIVRMPDRNGTVESIVLRFPDLTGYIAHKGLYLGAIVGRTAGRIDGAAFPLNGAMYDLPKNDGDNSLHGNGAPSSLLPRLRFCVPQRLVCNY